MGVNAFLFAEMYFNGVITSTDPEPLPETGHALTAYPNPLRRGGLLRVEFEQPTGPATLEAFNMLGQRVWIEPVSWGTSATFRTGNLAPGVYIVRLSMENAVPVHTTVIIR